MRVSLRTRLRVCVNLYYDAPCLIAAACQGAGRGFNQSCAGAKRFPQIHGLAADPRQVGMIPGRAPTQFRFQNSALVLPSFCCSQDNMLPPRLHQSICQPLVCQVGHGRVVWHPVRHRGLEDFDRQLVIVDQIRIVVEEHGCEGLASTLNTTSNSPRMQGKNKRKGRR